VRKQAESQKKHSFRCFTHEIQHQHTILYSVKCYFYFHVVLVILFVRHFLHYSKRNRNFAADKNRKTYGQSYIIGEEVGIHSENYI